MTLKEWLGTAAVALGIGTTVYNLGSNYIDAVRTHAIADKARDDDRVLLHEQITKVFNRVGVLEEIDYKVHPDYALDIYYANGDVEHLKLRRP